ncbi:MAG: DUF2793 domain-containing protein [Rhizobiaceae bacterium]|nr:DUF2793 domain-containing protein [Rhizobiaceae bacterium]
MEITPKNRLPYIMPQQAQKHVTHNEAIRMLDALIQISVAAIVDDPASISPEEGDCVLIGSSPLGEFEGKTDYLASFVDGAWMLHQPVIGWLAYRQDLGKIIAFTDAGWIIASGVPEEIQNLDLLGVNATADSINRLSINSPASLFNHEGQGHQVKVNKSSELDTASLLFQTGFSGRAEMGIAGSDNFSIKVAADDGTWRDAVSVNRQDGKVEFPSGFSSVPLHGRPGDVSGFDQIYIDAINGDDANDGYSLSEPIKSFGRLQTQLTVGRKLEIRLLSDIVADEVVDLSYSLPHLYIRGRTSNDSGGQNRTITVADATNHTTHSGGFIFQAFASIFLNRVDVELATSRSYAFFDFVSSMGFLRTRNMNLTRTGTGDCCLFGNPDSYVPNSHFSLNVSSAAKGFVAEGVGATDNPNDDWRYPSNLSVY